MPSTSSLAASRRHEILLSILDTDGAIELSTAANRLDVSEMTIRRDLAELETAGLVRRVRGGATRAPSGPRSFATREAQSRSAKRIIARKAASLAPEKGAVGIDASTTAAVLARLLAPRKRISFVTNSWSTFSILRETPGTDASLTGGTADPTTGSLVGPLSCRGAGAFSYRAFFTSASAVDPQLGSTDVSLDEAQVKQEFARSSDSVILLADSSKFHQRDLARSFSWDQIDVLVTELDPNSTRLDAYRELVAIL
ncbi:MAG TPA: DeoR/GlpR family DNA-binding transcription regulator [Thermomicrobiales bacterium]|nr:DeoR/GlpR family DNA-binding transcription regulator [Thermomicrobiales bacterium]